MCNKPVNGKIISFAPCWPSVRQNLQLACTDITTQLTQCVSCWHTSPPYITSSIASNLSNTRDTRWLKRMFSQTQNTERIGKEAENLTRLPISSAMDQSPFWEANSSSPSQEILRTVRYKMVRYGVHNSPPLVTILGQFNIAHALLRSQNNITLPSRPRSSIWSPFNRFLRRNPAFLFSHIHATCPVCLILLNHAISNCTVQ